MGGREGGREGGEGGNFTRNYELFYMLTTHHFPYLSLACSFMPTCTSERFVITFSAILLGAAASEWQNEVGIK